ncbi:MAG: ribosome-associated translation inhibitor RaiA [Alphaproteobacteria bacterium]
MHLQIHGKQIDIGAALREHTEAKLGALVEKYFDRATSGTITYSRDGNDIRCDAHVHLASGMMLQTSGQASEPYGALDQTLERLETRLKRYMSRLKHHHKESRGPIEASTAPDYVIQDREGHEPLTLEPVIIAEMTAEIKRFTVGEAVLQMSLLEMPALFFRNRGNGRLNLVYRRSDGHIGWIDPPDQKST